jgi:hypothetical protein
LDSGGLFINIARMGKTKDLSKDCKNIVLNLFKFFQLEKTRGRPFYSPENLNRFNTMFLQSFDKSFVLPILAMFIYMLRCQKIGL